jgi:hypothetical protein
LTLEIVSLIQESCLVNKNRGHLETDFSDIPLYAQDSNSTNYRKNPAKLQRQVDYHVLKVPTPILLQYKRIIDILQALKPSNETAIISKK